MAKTFPNFTLIDSPAPAKRGSVLREEIRRVLGTDGSILLMGYSTPDTSDDLIGEIRRLGIPALIKMASEIDIMVSASTDYLNNPWVELQPLNFQPGSEDQHIFVGYTNGPDEDGNVTGGFHFGFLPLDDTGVFRHEGDRLRLSPSSAATLAYLLWDAAESKWSPGQWRLAVSNPPAPEPSHLTGDGSLDSPLTITSGPYTPHTSIRWEGTHWEVNLLDLADGLQHVDTNSLALKFHGDLDGIESREALAWVSGEWSHSKIEDGVVADDDFIAGGGVEAAGNLPLHIKPHPISEIAIHRFRVPEPPASGHWEHGGKEMLYPLSEENGLEAVNIYSDYPNYVLDSFNPHALSRQLIYRKVRSQNFTFTLDDVDEVRTIIFGNERFIEVAMVANFASDALVTPSIAFRGLVPGGRYKVALRAGGGSLSLFELRESSFTLSTAPNPDVYADDSPVTNITLSIPEIRVLDAHQPDTNNMMLEIVVGIDTAYVHTPPPVLYVPREFLTQPYSYVENGLVWAAILGEVDPILQPYSNIEGGVTNFVESIENGDIFTGVIQSEDGLIEAYELNAPDPTEVDYFEPI